MNQRAQELRPEPRVRPTHGVHYLGTVSSEPTVREGPVTTPLLLKLLVAGGLSLAVVSLLPHTVSGGGAVPPIRMLLETAVVVSVICAAALFWGIRSDLGLPTKVAVYAVLFSSSSPSGRTGSTRSTRSRSSRAASRSTTAWPLSRPRP